MLSNKKMDRRYFLKTVGYALVGTAAGLYADNFIKDSDYTKKFQEICSEINKTGEIWGPPEDPLARQRFVRDVDFDGDGKPDITKGKVRYFVDGNDLMFIETNLS
ncbi:MAG: hypothetical protein KAS04_02490, partial [Candidatus Aenigmarchaeota archaeon]|nr:hypothetical protein [Candidatus Aenigmarchaeota archaeon]